MNIAIKGKKAYDLRPVKLQIMNKEQELILSWKSVAVSGEDRLQCNQVFLFDPKEGLEKGIDVMDLMVALAYDPGSRMVIWYDCPEIRKGPFEVDLVDGSSVYPIPYRIVSLAKIPRNFLHVLNEEVEENDDSYGSIDERAVRQMVTELEHTVNNFSYSPERVYRDFRDSLMVSEARVKKAAKGAEDRLFVLALHWIWFFGTLPIAMPDRGSKEQYYIFVDDRNRLAVERCRYLAGCPEYQRYAGIYHVEIDYSDPRWRQQLDVYEQFYRAFMDYVNRDMHKTLIQSATRLMLYALGEADPGIRRALVSEYGDRYHALPLI